MRELYLIFMRLLASFRIETAEKIDCDPSKDMKIPTDLIMAPRAYRVSFKPRNEGKLVESLASTTFHVVPQFNEKMSLLPSGIGYLRDQHTLLY